MALALSVLMGLPALSVTGPVSVDDYATIMTGGDGGVILIAILAGLLGVFSLGHEYRHGTIRPTLTALPRRLFVLAAKAIVVLAFVACLAAVAQILRYIVALLIWGHRLTDLGLFPGPLGRIWIGVIAYIVVFALVGLGLAGLFRSTPGPIVALIAVPLIVENVIRALLSIDALSPIRGVAKVLPFSAGARVFSHDTSQNLGPAGFGEVPSPNIGLFIFVVFLAIVLALTWVLFERRDA
jgi:ABC-type transport system involved in multi-copper enzyme maturation permease subunit